MKSRTLLLITLGFAILGILDATYLTIEHYSNEIPPCSISAFADCGKVLRSKYAMVGPVPLSVLGIVYYASVFALVSARVILSPKMSWMQTMWSKVQSIVHPAKKWGLPEFLRDMQLLMTLTGVVFSAYFVYLQLGVIKAICLYCMVSAINSMILFGLTVGERKFSV